jgi:hypothetical protein
MLARWALTRVMTLVALLAAAPTTNAQPGSEPTATEVAIARGHFRDAEKLMKQGEWAGAVEKLEQVVAIKESAGVRFHLAMAQEQQGRLVDALNNLDRAEELIRDGAREPETAKLIDPARQALEARIPTVMVTCAEPCPPTTTLTIDGKRLALVLLGKPIFLDPGEHRIELDTPGRGQWGTTITLAEGAREEISATLPKPSPRPVMPASPTPAAASADEPEPSRTRDYVLIGEGALAGIGLGTGIVFYFLYRGADERADSLHGDRSACVAPTAPDEQRRCADLREAVDEEDRYAVLSTTGFVVAGLGVASLVATYLLWRPEPASGSTRPRSYFVARAEPGLYQLSVLGSF